MSRKVSILFIVFLIFKIFLFKMNRIAMKKTSGSIEGEKNRRWGHWLLVLPPSVKFCWALEKKQFLFKKLFEALKCLSRHRHRINVALKTSEMDSRWLNLTSFGLQMKSSVWPMSWTFLRRTLEGRIPPSPKLRIIMGEGGGVDGEREPRCGGGYWK